MAVNVLKRRGLSTVSPDCPICGVKETSAQMTFGCSLTKIIWFGMLGILGANQVSQSIEEWLIDRMTDTGSMMSRRHKTRWSICMTTCWIIGKARCKEIFEVTMSHPRVDLTENKAAIAEIDQLPN